MNTSKAVNKQKEGDWGQSGANETAIVAQSSMNDHPNRLLWGGRRQQLMSPPLSSHVITPERATAEQQHQQQRSQQWNHEGQAELAPAFASVSSTTSSPIVISTAAAAAAAIVTPSSSSSSPSSHYLPDVLRSKYGTAAHPTRPNYDAAAGEKAGNSLGFLIRHDTTSSVSSLEATDYEHDHKMTASATSSRRLEQQQQQQQQPFRGKIQYDGNDDNEGDDDDDDDDDDEVNIIAIGIPHHDPKQLPTAPSTATTESLLSRAVAENVAQHEHDLKRKAKQIVQGSKRDDSIKAAAKAARQHAIIMSAAAMPGPALAPPAVTAPPPQKPPPLLSPPVKNDALAQVKATEKAWRVAAGADAAAAGAATHNATAIATPSAAAAAITTTTTTAAPGTATRHGATADRARIAAKVAAASSSSSRPPPQRHSPASPPPGPPSPPHHHHRPAHGGAMTDTAARREREKLRAYQNATTPRLGSSSSTESSYGGGAGTSCLQLSEQASGPSLAPAVSREMSYMWGHHDLEEEHHNNDSLGPRLAPATDAADDDDEDIIEAQAGIPVVLPGAFAIEGMNARHSSDVSTDELVESSSSSSSPARLRPHETADQNSMLAATTANTTAAATTTTTPATTNEQAPALLAELAEDEDAVVVDGAVWHDTDAVLDAKMLRRLRVMQAMILCFSVVALTMVIVSVVGFAQGGPPVQEQRGVLWGWTAVGDSVYGNIEEPQVLFGQSLQLSADGRRLAVAAPGTDDDNTLNVGEVRVFDAVVDDDYDGGTRNDNGTAVLGAVTWELVDVLPGFAYSSDASSAVAMSGDGRIIAVGYPRVAGGGTVQLFQENNNGSTFQSVARIGLNSTDEIWFGHDVALSADGRVLAIGAPLRNTDADGEQSGAVSVYQLNNDNVWRKVGNDLVGAAAEFIGWSVAVQSLSNGNIIVAMGGPVSQADAGVVRVFAWDSSLRRWQPQGDTLVGATPLSRFGETVALSHDGMVLAVGARGNAFSTGQAYVYKWKNKNWVVDDSSSFVGEEAGEAFGSALALSADGTVVAVAGPYSTEFAASAGRIRVWKFNGLEWQREGSSIGSSDLLEGGFGGAVALSADGQRVAGGAPLATYDGKQPENGVVRVFDRDINEEIENV